MDTFEKFLEEFKDFMEKTPQEEIDRRWKEALSNNEGGITVGEMMAQPIIPSRHER